MDIEKVVHGLHSKTRREILKLLCIEDLSATEIFEKLKINKPNYRQSVHKALQLLKSSGLVEKYYSSEKNLICYKIKQKKIILDLFNMEIE